MNYQNDPHFYDYCFYPKRWPLLLGVLFFGIVAGVGPWLLHLRIEKLS